MAVSLRRLAASAPTPVFVVAGPRSRTAARRLSIDPRLAVVDSPRHATVLLVVGAVPVDHAPALRQLHDQLPHPRAAAWWCRGLDGPSRGVLPSVAEVDVDPVAAVVQLHREVVIGDRGSSPALGPDRNPTAWQGVGPHGQGGEGMMGGTPYGRSMAMTGDDLRDGLQLDRVPLTVGPYHSAFPPGLTLDLELQGDVVVSCQVRRAGPELVGTVPELPGERPDILLLWLADLVRVHGLGALARRLTRAAFDGRDSDRLRSRARRALVPALRAVGRIDGEDALDRVVRLLGAPSPPQLNERVVSDHLPGLEWGEAVSTIWSLGAWYYEGDRAVAAT